VVSGVAAEAVGAGMSEPVRIGDALTRLREMGEGSVHCVVTSPPYFGLRDYGVAGQLGLEATPELYVERMVEVFREVRRVLRGDGTLWCNLGDSYNAYNGGAGPSSALSQRQSRERPDLPTGYGLRTKGLKPKDLVGIPWRVAFALQADGWYLRSDIIWCLSGGTYVYAWTQKGPAPMMVKDLARLDSHTVRLWNGERWTRLTGVSRSPRAGTELEIVLRSGERIACTPTHRFPTDRGLLAAADIQAGDVIRRTTLPEPTDPRDCALDEDAAWFAGLYLAEGSRAGDTIQIAGHARETKRLDRLREIAAKYGGSLAVTVQGNGQAVRMYGKVLAAILAELVSGKTAHDKGFAPVVWRYSNRFLAAMVDGYLSGDGHYDAENNRWRLGFCRNYNLERDLRTACARLGWRLVLHLATVAYRGRRVPTFRGELRKAEPNGHHNEKPLGQVVEIRRARCRNVYDLGVEDEPHLFALASGVLTHNSKPNPMPESVTDRPTKSHEYVFLLSKSPRYFWDAEAIKETCESGPSDVRKMVESLPRIGGKHKDLVDLLSKASGATNIGQKRSVGDPSGRNARTVWKIPYSLSDAKAVLALMNAGVGEGDLWTIATAPFKGAHFATFPEELARRCIMAGTSTRGCCPVCGAPWRRVVGRGELRSTDGTADDYRPAKDADGDARIKGRSDGWTPNHVRDTQTTGWAPTCAHALDPVPCTALDPFAGAGTVGLVAQGLGREYVLIELKPEYAEMARARIHAEAPLFAEATP